MKLLRGIKTYANGVLIIGVGVGGWLTGSLETITALGWVLGGVQTIFMRQGINNAMREAFQYLK